MAVFDVQDDSGSVAGANAYITVAEFKSYHNARGNDFSAYGGGSIEKAIVKATDYLDQRFTFVGEMASVAQRTQWPRLSAEDASENLRTGIPFEVKEACAEYALIAAGQELNPVPTTPSSVKRKREKVGPIEEETEYAGSAFSLPTYPAADYKLFTSGLAMRGKIIRRA
jgi:hypothetical protein